MQFDFNVGPNQSQHIDVVGSFVKYKGGTGTIRVRLNGGGYIDLLPGQGVNGVNFTSIDVQDRTGAQNVGTVLAGIYDFRDDRITGTVDVLDGGKSRTNAGTACMGYAFTSGAAAAHSFVQLLNPAGSGKNIYIEQVGFFSTGAVTSGIGIRRYDTALPTLYGKGQKKKVDGPVSVAEMRCDAPAVDPAWPYPYMGALDKALKLFRFTEPLQLPPGTGIVLTNGDLNEDLGATFEYFEEPI